MDSDKLFSEVNFFIAECNDPDEIKDILLSGGARHINYLSDRVSHVVADKSCPDAEEAVELFDKPVVSSLWVHLCVRAKRILPPEAFSPLRRIFHNAIVTFSQNLSRTDIDVLAATLTFYGGKLTKELEMATHLVTATLNPIEIQNGSHNVTSRLKLVGPDWITDSVKSRNALDEALYDPILLLDPPPPKPPTPPPTAPPSTTVAPSSDIAKGQNNKEVNEIDNRPKATPPMLVDDNARKNDFPYQVQNPSMPQQQPRFQQHQQQQQPQQQQINIMQSMPSTQLPRPRVPNIIRGVQPRFRPMLPSNPNMAQGPPRLQGPHPQARMMVADPQQQPRKMIDYNHAYRKVGPPYQGGPEMQQMQSQQPIQNYQQMQPQMLHQSGPPMNQVSRLPQPNVYQQQRPVYQNSHMPPRMPPQMGQASMMNQQQMQPQPMNRFQDPNSQMSQPRPYQVCMPQQQPVNQGYQPNNTHRQPIYYNQNPNMHMRMPQQGPMVRQMVPNEQVIHENYNPPMDTMQDHNQYPNQQQMYQHQRHPIQPQPQPQLTLPPHPQPQSHPHPQPNPQPHPQSHPQAQPQAQHQLQPPPQPQLQPQMQPQPQLVPQSQNQFQKSQPFQQPHPPVVVQGQPRPQFQPNMPNTSTPHNIRGMRNQMPIQPEMKQTMRLAGPTQVERPPRAPRAPATQPHPSIFELKQELSYNLMKSKVPILTDNIEYFAHPPDLEVPPKKAFANCIFMLIEHNDINPKLKKRWCEAIEEAGGSFSDNISDLTHIICESRSTPMYAEAMKNGIRCVTVYWINDVLADDKMTYPWKALHLPTPFSKDDKPLQNQIISTTNLKGVERRAVREMIVKTGAKYTDYFSQTNTLLICGSPGGQKFERAIEWRTPIANCQLLSDFLISGRDFSQMLAHAKYQNFNRGDQLRLDSYVLVRDLMDSWTKPLAINEKVKNIPVANGVPISSDRPATNHTNIIDDSGIVSGSSNNSDLDPTKASSEQPKDPQSLACVDGTRKEDIKEQGGEGSTEQQTATADAALVQNPDLKAPVQTLDKSESTTGSQADKEAPSSDISMDIDNEPINESQQASTDTSVSEVVSEPKPEELKSTDLKEPNPSTACAITETEVVEKVVRTSDQPVRILFTRLDQKLVSQLVSHAVKLGLSIASSPEKCTHLLVDRLSRTPKFIRAFSHAHYILSYKWLVESQEFGQVLDEKRYILQDEEGEVKYSFNLVYSLVKRKKRKDPIFKNMVFFVTPTVMSSVPSLKEMIESAGGSLETRKLPNKAQLSQMRADCKRFVIVASRKDLHICSPIEPGTEIVDKEFIISGILRQDIDFESHRIKHNSRLPIGPNHVSSNLVVRPSPDKRLRIE